MSGKSPMGALLDRIDRIAAVLEARLGGAVAGSDVAPPGRAFVWEFGGGFRPVRRPAAVEPDLLLGIERQKQVLYRNVQGFLSGRPAHDVLLWGDRGTGKSSLVRSLLTEFHVGELALLEVPEARIPDLPRVLDALQSDHRRWVIYLDDLSFRGPGDGYRELKVLLEGGLEDRPENTLVIATSNRRHLVPEAFPPTGEIHPEEAVAESVSLADRFGLSLGFYPFDEATYLQAVEGHLRHLGMNSPPGDWQAEALRWAMSRGIRSGRAALQAARELAAQAGSKSGGDAGQC